jgi:hypothetical protein
MKFALLTAASLAGFAGMSSHADAQWWTAAPADFEECAERADRTSDVPDVRTKAMIACESKFAGRRKAGGGYAYYDFLQDRTFNIAGPNPTVAEQKTIDEEYKKYLESHRRSVIVAAFAEKQRELEQQPAPDGNPAAEVATSKDVKTVAVPTPKPRPHIKGPDCANEPLACGWAKLSSGIQNIKNTLFGAPPLPKTKRT